MLKRDVILPALTTLVIASLFVFISCASSERVEDDSDPDFASSEESVTDGGAPGAVDAENKVEGEMAQAGNPQDQLSELNAAHDKDVAVPAADGEKELEGSIAENDANKASADLGTKMDAAAPSTPPLETAPLDPAAPAPSLASTDPALTPPSDPVAEAAVAGLDEPKPAAKKSHRHARAGHSMVSHIPGSAIRRGKVQLNRFYFVRGGDTPASVSQLIYGNEGRASDLAFWNGHTKSWKPGRTIFYRSPSQPDDQKMRAFFEERGIPSEEYIVKRSDWLSKIAQVKLGDPRSWKEIAAVNGVDRPDSIEVGQKLLVFPQDLHGFTAEHSAPAQVAAKPQPVEPPASKAAVIPPPVAQTLPQLPENNPTPIKENGKGGGLDFKQLLDQNAPAGLFVAIGLILLLALVAINKKKKGRKEEEFGEEGFASKAKRR